MKGKHISKGVTHAIKHINDVFYNTYEAKKVCREISLMRNLSRNAFNIYTVKLLDVFIPQKGQTSNLNNGMLFDDLMLIQEHFGQDLKKLIE